METDCVDWERYILRYACGVVHHDDSRSLRALAALLCVAATACGGTSHVITPDEGTERVWRPSYVVIVGRDPHSPKVLPEGCKKLGSVTVTAANEKISYHSEFREGAQRLGGNAVADVVHLSPLRQQGNVYTCPFFADAEPNETSIANEPVEYEESDALSNSDGEVIAREVDRSDASCGTGGGGKGWGTISMPGEPRPARCPSALSSDQHQSSSELGTCTAWPDVEIAIERAEGGDGLFPDWPLGAVSEFQGCAVASRMGSSKASARFEIHGEHGVSPKRVKLKSASMNKYASGCIMGLLQSWPMPKTQSETKKLMFDLTIECDGSCGNRNH